MSISEASGERKRGKEREAENDKGVNMNMPGAIRDYFFMIIAEFSLAEW